MESYIKGTAMISPQRTFEDKGFPEEVINYTGADYLGCIEPSYRDYIDPMVARRMSRIVKMGVCAAIRCMKNSNVEMPDAVLAGTGLGCLEDTEKFLGSIFNNAEKLLNPTPFIQSTHNTVAAAIALAIKCHNYNATYTHRGFSFESAIQDALLQLAEKPEANILTGGFDELTVNSYHITKRLGMWKNHPVTSLRLKEYNTRGSLPGEGTAFFMLSGIHGSHDIAALKAMRTFYKPRDHHEIENHLDQLLGEAGVHLHDVSLMMLGVNGDPSTDSMYYRLMSDRCNRLPGAYFKHLCGEYDTASSFALWLSAILLKNQVIPESIGLTGNLPGVLDNIVIYNHLRGSYHAMYLLSRC
ncbi:MAG TPA: beta-ketoacyl synthase chain length factor [Bacteroidales bacterium]|nr:beta-ketoacyl synthase chain length factor [Bacteroidales bacterium]